MKKNIHSALDLPKLGTLFLFLILFCNVKAQQQLPPARVSTFTYSPGVSHQQADQVGRTVEGYFTNAKRFNMITSDRTAIDEELERQKDGIFLNGYMVEQNRAMGAKYLVVGHLINTDDGLDYATIQLGVVDVGTGENVAVETLSPSGRSAATLIMATDETIRSVGEPSNNPTASVIGAVAKIAIKKRLEKNVMDFLDEHFPMNFLITGMTEDDNKVTEVELYGYQTHEFRKRETFKVVQQIKRKMPDNRIAIQEKEVATLTVDVVEGDLAQCKVSKQDQEMLYEYKDAEGITVIKK